MFSEERTTLWKVFSQVVKDDVERLEAVVTLDMHPYVVEAINAVPYAEQVILSYNCDSFDEKPSTALDEQALIDKVMSTLRYLANSE